MELIGLMCFLAFVAAAFYGMYSLIAGSNRPGAPATTDQPVERTPNARRCWSCGASFYAHRCIGCGAWAPSLPAGASPASHTIHHAIERAFAEKAIDSETFRKFFTLLFDAASPSKASVGAREVDAPTREMIEIAEPTEVEPAAVALSPPAPLEPEIVYAQTVDETPPAPVSPFANRHRVEPAPPPEPVVPVEPAKPWTEWLVALMEEGNIRWGELIGGLLIVGCSLALVITFWSEIAQRPLMKFLIFNGFTASLFGVGVYTMRQWKLKATSEGVLTIAVALVPLNLLGMAAFQQGAEWNWPLIGGEIVSIALLGALTCVAAAYMTPDARWPTAIGVMVPSALLLVARRAHVAIGPVAGDATAAFALASAGCAGLWSRFVASKDKSSTEWTPLGPTLRGFAMPMYAATIVVGFMVWRSDGAVEAMHRLSPLLALAAFPVAALGWSLVAENDRRPADSQDAQRRFLGVCLGFGAAAAVFLAIVAAWPSPARLAIALSLAFVAAGVLSWRLNLPVLLSIAVPLAAGVWAIAWHWFRGTIDGDEFQGRRLAQALVNHQSGLAWLPLVAGTIAASLAARSEATRRFGEMLRLGAAGVACLGVVLIAWHGLGRAGDPIGASLIVLAYAACAWVVADQGAGVAALGGAMGLIVMATVQGVVYWTDVRLDVPHGWAFAMAIDGLLFCAAREWFARSADPRRRGFLPVAEWAAQSVAAAGAVALVVEPVFHGWKPTAMATAAGALALVSLALAWRMRMRDWFVAFQALSTIAAGVGCVAIVERTEWFRGLERPWFDPGVWVMFAGVLATLAVAWSVWEWRRAIVNAAAPSGAERSDFDKWTLDARPATGGLLATASLVALLVVATYSAIPPIAWEWSAAGSEAIAGTFEVAGLRHEHGRGVAAWVALAIAGVALVARRFAAGATAPSQGELAWRRARFAGAVLLGWSALLSLSGGFEGVRSSAAVLGFASVGAFVVGCVVYAFLARDDSESLEPLGWLALGTLAPWFLAGTIAAFSVAARAHGVPIVSVAITCGFLATFATGMLARRGGSVAMSEAARTYVRMIAVIAALATTSLEAWLIVDGAIGTPLNGPLAATALAGWSPAWLYGGPLVALVVAAAGLAWRFRSEDLASVACGGVHAGAAVALFASRSVGELSWTPDLTAAFVQTHVIVAAACGGLWALIKRFLGQRGEGSRWTAHALAAPAIALAALAPCWTAMVVAPVETHAAGWPSLFVPPLSWIAVAAALTMAALVNFRIKCFGAKSALIVLALATATLAACVVATFAGPWEAFHVLLASQCLAPIVVLTAAATIDVIGVQTVPEWAKTLAPRWTRVQAAGVSIWPWRRWVVGHVALAGGIAMAVAVRAWFAGPQSTWWAVAAFATLAATAIAAGGWSRARAMAYAIFPPVVAVAITLWDQSPGVVGDLFGLFGWCFASLGVVSTATSLLDRFLFGRMRVEGEACYLPRASRPVSWIGAVAAFTMTALVLLAQWHGMGPDGTTVTAWLFRAALVAVVASLATLLWDDEAPEALPALYVGGLIVVLGGVIEANAKGQGLTLILMAALGAYGVLVSYLSSRREGVRELAVSWGIDAAPEDVDRHARWLMPLQSVWAIAVVVIAGLMSLTYEGAVFRKAAAMPILGQAIALGLLARGERRTWMQTGALALASLHSVAVAWGGLAPLPEGLWVDHVVTAGAVFAVTGLIYGMGLVKLLPADSEWLAAARRLVPVALGLAAACVLVVFAYECLATLQGRPVHVGPIAIAALSAIFGGLAVAAILAAIVPGRDPLNLSERGRQVYVYGAEIALVLLAAHLRMTMPEVFAGVFALYWPIACMGVAFLGAGLGEYFERRRSPVLGEPLRNTGVLAPALPAIGYWAAPTGTDYAWILFSAALLYAGLAAARRSFGLAILSAIALNGCLWSVLWRTPSLAFLEHPQAWLAPAAVSVLAAAQFSRDKLPKPTLSAIRYAAALVLYASSTADMVLQGVVHAPWLPAVLAGLAIAGVFVGIALRVRAFLYLGVSFLVVALIAVIKLAAVDLHQTWLLWVAGIATGAAIIAVFAVFEKRREDILAAIERLKSWEG